MKATILCILISIFFTALMGQTNISANITSSQTWTPAGSPYIINNNISVGGGAVPVLTIQAGVEVRLNPGVIISIGSAVSNSGGAIVADGTSDDPVVFTANTDTPAPGFWNCLQTLSYVHATSTFTHTVFEYGGSGSGMFTVNNNQSAYVPQFEQCVFRHSANYGLYHTSTNVNIGASVTNCAFASNAGYPLQVNANQAYKIGTGNTFSLNGVNRILLRDVTIQTPQSWLDQGVPYEAEADLRVQMTSDAVLELDEGVEICFRLNHAFYVGSISSSYRGGLVATGAVLSGCDGLVWDGIQFQPYLTTSTLDNCTVREVSATAPGAVYIRSSNASVNINACNITSNFGYGIYANDNTQFGIMGTAFQLNPMTVSVTARDLYKLGSGNSYLNNTDNRVHCRGGIISSATSWTNQGTPVLMQANINLQFSSPGALTIPFGIILEFASNTYFGVGSSSSSFTGALNATGVIFRGASASAGYWQGLLFENYGGSSLLSGCTIRDAGYGNLAGIRFKIAAGTMTGCQILNCLSVGIRYETNMVQVALSGNNISGCGSYPLSLPANCVRAIGPGNDFTGNTLNKVEVRAENLTVSCTWIDPGVPYFLNGTVNVAGASNCHLKILSGTVLYLPAAGNLIVGSASSSLSGSLEAEGVTFTSDPAGAISYGLIFNSYAAHALCVLKNCVFENLQHATHNVAIYVNNAFPSFIGCSFQNNGGSGVAGSDAAKFTLTDCVFLNNGYYPVRTSARAFDAVSGTGNYFSGNTPDRIQISGGTLDLNYIWDNPSVPVEVTSSINVNSGAGCILKINSGLTLLFAAGTGLNIGSISSSLRGNLRADGATFSALNGSSGGWNGITLNPYLQDAASGYIRNCVVEYAGGNGNIYFNNSAFPLVESSVLRHGSYGVKLSGNNSQPAIIRNYIQSNGVGVHCSNNSNPLIGGNTGDGNSLDGNLSYGVQNTSTLTVNAEYNWWGDASGPAHSGNPGGLGDAVSNNVDYDPWRASDIGDAPARFHLLNPDDGAILETLQPVLDWEEAIDPSPGDTVTYTLELAENSGFTLGLISVTPLSATVYHVPDAMLEDDTRYYWRVKASDTQDQVTLCYENYWYFDTAVPEPPVAFSLLGPAYNATLDLTSNLLDWQASSDPDPGDYVTYTVYWDVSAGFDTAVSFTTSDTWVWSGFCAPGSLIYWKVKAFDSTGRETFSPVWRFYVNADARPRAPVAFTLTPLGSDLQITWDTVPGADTYDLHYSVLPYGGFSLLQAGLTTPEFLHPGAAAGPSGFYYVIAHDDF